MPWPFKSVPTFMSHQVALGSASKVVRLEATCCNGHIWEVIGQDDSSVWEAASDTCCLQCGAKPAAIVRLSLEDPTKVVECRA